MEFENSAPVAMRLQDAVATHLIGREQERAHLRDLLTPGVGPLVVVVCGPGGIGKSALVAATVAELALPQLMLDGKLVEPTPSGFLTAIATEIGSGPLASCAQAGRALGARGVRLIVIDSFERLNLLDGWLRNEFVPSLPADMTTALVGRRPTNPAWRTAPGWRLLLAELEVGELARSDAAALVARRDLSPEIAEQVLHFGHGHPLALELAAEAFSRHTHLQLVDGPPPHVLEELFEVLLDDLAPAERRTVETASILRRVTRPLLAAVLGGAVRGPDGPVNTQDVEAAWRTLREVPFTSMSRIGLELDPLARHVIAGGLEIRDPEYVVQVRRRAALAALRHAGGARSWDATADLLYLVQNQVIRDSYVPPGDRQHPVETAVTDDLDAIMSISHQHDGPDATRAIVDWWRSHARGFSVSRGPAGQVMAFGVVVRWADLDLRLAATDPVVAAATQDMRLRPPPVDSEVLVHRRSLGRRKGESPSPELGSMIVDLKRLYLELRPRLTRVYAVVADWERNGPVMRVMGFGRIGDEIFIGERGFHLCVLDFGPGSVDGWLARHVLVESELPSVSDAGGALSRPDPPGHPDPLRHPDPTGHPDLPGPPALPPAADRPPVGRLSAREREVLAALADGLTNMELANRLFISERTANRHLSNIFTKLGVRNRTAAARIAIEAGLAG